jgi:hypothetical protein
MSPRASVDDVDGCKTRSAGGLRIRIRRSQNDYQGERAISAASQKL